MRPLGPVHLVRRHDGLEIGRQAGDSISVPGSLLSIWDGLTVGEIYQSSEQPVICIQIPGFGINCP